MSVLWVGLEFIVSCIQWVYLLLVPTFQLGLQNRIKKWHIIVYILLSTILTTLYNYLTGNSVSSIYPFFILIITYVLCFNIGRWFAKVFWIVFPFSAYYVFELSIMKAMLTVCPISAEIFASHNIYRFLGMIICVLFETIILVISYHFQLKVNNESRILLIPILISLVLLPFLHLTGQQIWQLSIVFLLIHAIYFLYIIRSNQKIKIKQLELKTKNANESTALREYFSKYQGDVNESLQMIWGLAKLHNIPEIEKYLKQFSEINMRFAQVFNTGNHFLDTILTTKYAFAKENNIKFRIDIETPLVESFNYIDIGNLLIHLIDNALEAVDQVPVDNDEMRYIHLSIQSYSDNLMILLENKTDKIDVPPLNELLSKNNEGLGLKAVKEIVDKYNAKFETHHVDDIFTASIHLSI